MKKYELDNRNKLIFELIKTCVTLDFLSQLTCNHNNFPYISAAVEKFFVKEYMD